MRLLNNWVKMNLGANIYFCQFPDPVILILFFWRKLFIILSPPIPFQPVLNPTPLLLPLAQLFDSGFLPL